MATPYIDLRSDTVTRPTPEMRRAMANAEVGDDVLGDDPTIIKLQERFAALLGKEAACYVPSGTMANQTSIRAHCEPGDEVITHEDGHIIHYETGSPAALSGVMVRALRGPRGMFEAGDVEAAVRPDSSHFARSRLLIVENTHNRGGGAVWPMEKIKAVTEKGRSLGLKLHLDGARLWNACIATGHKPADYARHFDTVSCCFSKGLGAPVGSAVAGDRATITRVHRFRKMFGGATRQGGVIAAAALYAMENHFERLAEDHANARRLAEGLAEIPGLRLDLAEVETNMVFFDLDVTVPMSGAQFCEKLKSEGVLMMATGPRRIRSVVHLDVTRDMIDNAIHRVGSVVGARVTV